MHRKSSSKVRISDRTVLHPADRKSEVIDYLKLASASTSSSEVSIHPDKIKVNDIKEALEKAQEGVVKCTEHFKNLEEIKINARAYEQSQDVSILIIRFAFGSDKFSLQLRRCLFFSYIFSSLRRCISAAQNRRFFSH